MQQFKIVTLNSLYLSSGISHPQRMIKYTKTTLQKLIRIFHEQEYVVRFEKGHFQSGYAFVHEKKIVVINKFFDTESRINAVLEILDQIKINKALLDEASFKYYKSLVKEGLIKPMEE
jgi:hypothetical protein